jgi:hypothetical protein
MGVKLNIFKIFDVLIGTFIGIFGGYILQTNSFNGFKDWSMAIIVFTMVSILIYLINFVISNRVQNNTSFLRRWFSASYIEGEWIQIIYDTNLKQTPPTKYSIVTIYFEDGIYKISGASYNQDNGGDQMTNFRSKHSSFFEYVLTYYYAFDTRESRAKKDWFGRCKFTFSSYDGCRYPNKYEGEIHSNIRRNPVMVRAIKIRKKMKITVKTNEGRIKIDELVKNAF